MRIARWVPNKQFIGALDGISKKYNEISSQQTWGIDSNGRYYGSDISEGAIENAIRRRFGSNSLRRLEGWRLESRNASAEFLKDQALKQPAFRSKVRNWQKRISFYPTAPSD